MGPFGPRSESLRGGLRLFFGGASGPKLRLRGAPAPPPPASGRGAQPLGPRREAAAAARAGGTAGPRTAVSAGARCAGRALFARARFADRERTSLERLLIESADRRFGDGAIRVIDERETARPAGFPIDGKNDLGGFTDARQVLA